MLVLEVDPILDGFAEAGACEEAWVLLIGWHFAWEGG